MIEISGLFKSFDNKTVLSGVDLTIPNGDTICVIGKSGSGKSVLLKHIVGLLAPDKGNVIVDGKVVENLSSKEIFKLRRRIGYVFQSAALFDSYSVYENTILSLYEHGTKDVKILEDEAIRVLSAVKLLPELSERNTQMFENEWKILKNKMPADLSGGMRKRVGVARALVGEPEYIFFDEPTTGLDPVTSEQIDDLINALTHELSVTSIVITHDMFSVFKIADTVAMLHEGKVRFHGTSEDLRKSNDEIVVEFLDRFVA